MMAENSEYVREYLIKLALIIKKTCEELYNWQEINRNKENYMK